MILSIGVIAYLPWPEQPLIDLTHQSVASLYRSFGEGPVTVYHAMEATPLAGLCARVHPGVVRGLRTALVVDYVNGNLMDNWRALLNDAFETDVPADWALFASNDLLWREGALSKIQAAMEGCRTDFHIISPTAAFLVSQVLWEKLKGDWDTAYPPSGFEDNDLAMRVWEEGGSIVEDVLQGAAEHVGEASIRMLGPDYHDGRHDQNFAANRQHFIDKWGFDPEPVPGKARLWPPPPEFMPPHGREYLARRGGR